MKEKSLCADKLFGKRPASRFTGCAIAGRILALAAVLALASPTMALAKEPIKPKSKQKFVSVDPADPKLKWGPCPDIFGKGCEVTILRGDAAKGASDVYLRTPGNFELPAHWHTSAEHIILVKGKFSVSYEGGGEAVVAPGAFTYGPAGLSHTARCNGPESCIIYIGFEKPVDAYLTKKK